MIGPRVALVLAVIAGVSCKAKPSTQVTTAPSASASIAPASATVVVAQAAPSVAPSTSAAPSASVAQTDVGMTCFDGMLVGPDAVTGFVPGPGGGLDNIGLNAMGGSSAGNGGGLAVKPNDVGIQGIGDLGQPDRWVVNLSGHTVGVEPLDATQEIGKSICLDFPAITPCFENTGGNDSLTLDLKIDAGGAVKTVTATGDTSKKAPLAKCVTDALAKLTLGKPKTVVTLGYALEAKAHFVPGTKNAIGVKPPETNVATAVANATALPGAESVVARNRWRFKNCYAKALAMDPSVEGTAKVAVKIGADGFVSSASAVSSNLPGALTSCVASSCNAMKFQEPASGTAMLMVTIALHPK